MKLSHKCLIGLPDIWSIEYCLSVLPKDRQTSTVDCADKVQKGQFLMNQEDWKDSSLIKGF